MTRPPVAPSTRAPAAGAAEPSPLQRRLWFLEQLGGPGTVYAAAGAVRLRGPLDPAALAAAAEAVLLGRPELLARCVDRDGTPVVVVEPQQRPALVTIDGTPGTVAAVAEGLVATLTHRGAGAALATVASDNHILVVAVHQAVGDATTVSDLIADIGAHYTGTPRARPYNVWPGAAEQAEHPLAALASTRAAALPADLPRPSVWRARGAIVPFEVPDTFAFGAATTEALLVATHLLLARHSGHWRGVLGLRAAGRTTALPLDLGRDLTFSTAMARVSTALDQARGVDAERLAEHAAGEPDLSRNPLFGVVVELADDVPADFGPQRVERVTVPTTTTRYDLVVRVRRTPTGGLTGELEYATALLTAAGAERLAARLTAVCAAADPHAPIGRLDVVPASERRILLPAARGTDSGLPLVSTPESISAQAARTPAAVAVECGAEHLTYARLMAVADTLAHKLRELGVRPGDLVGVAVPRGVDLLATLIGVHRAGAAYVPLDPDHPADRLAYILADAGAAVLVTTSAQRDSLPATPATIVAVDDLRPAPATEPLPRVGLDDPAYVIYTSGSTGRPKGVMVTHRALANFLASMRDRPGIDAGTAFPAVTTVSFDIAALELYLPLLVGGRVVVADAGEAGDPDRLAAMLDRIGARAMQATPVTWRLLLDSGWTPPAEFTALCGGEKLPDSLATRLCATGARLWDLYGPTETTVWSSVATVTNGVVAEFAAVANTTLYVLDEQLEPVPLGARGELYIGGDGLAVGYLGRPRLTADRFLPDPYGGGAGARIYRTGDVAARLPSGRIEILGRTDNQVKIRGHRVEPGEIEQALETHDGVRAAVVHPVTGADGDPMLVGYLRVADGAAPPPPHALYQHCARLIPTYMVPARFVVLDRFPTTPNGKIDRAALPAPDVRAQPPGQTRAPRTPTERAVARVLADLLDRPTIGVEEDFFALGGHSVLATRAISLLRAELGVDLGVADVFEGRTVERISARIAGRALAPRARPVTVRTRAASMPLSFAQRRMWFLHQVDPTSTAYHEPLVLRLDGPLDLAALHQALGALVDRHEILRTRYDTDAAGDPVAIIEPPVPVAPAVEDGELREVVGAELALPFDLAAGPPVRLRVVRTGGGEHAVVIVAHHIATDDRSHEVLTRDLHTLYRGDRPAPLAVRYADYAVWQREELTGPVLERELRFWRDGLTGLEPTELPGDRPRPPVRDTRGGTVRFTVAPPVVATLAEIGAARGATPFMTLLAGLFAILRRYTGGADLSVGVPVSGRTRPELDDLVGLFVNTVVIRAEVADRATFTELVDTVRDRAIAAFQHAEVPFELVVDEVAPQRDLSRNPLFGILFATHGLPAPATVEPPELTGAKFDLGVHLTASADGGMDGRVEYPVALFDASTVARFADHFTRLLHAVAASPGLRVDRIPLGTDEEPAAVQPAADHRTVCDLIAAHATTDAVAVTGHGRTLTYPELDREANQLAHRLRALGAGVGTFVVVRMPQDADLIVTLLAVLKSGAAYIPLDTDHPVERLHRALADSAATLVVAPLRTAAELPGGVRLVALDDPAERARISAHPTTPPRVEVTPDDLAYAVFTSGSTGRPKAATVTHGGLANYTRWAVEELAPSAGAGSPLHTSLAYDLALTSLYPTLADGAPVVLTDASVGVEPLAEVLTARADGPLGVVKLTPTHLDLLAATLPAATLADAALCVVVGGEELRGEQLAAWAAHAPGTRIVNSYGPSETAVACCVHIVPAGQAKPGPMPIGRPIPGATVHVLDDAMRTVPVGVVGELHVGGRGVGRGYLGDPARTADRFRPDPFSAEPGARLYRTGDLARRLPDGTLMFHGRRDHQVKIRGYRIEPGEVESVLAAHPGVHAVAVVADRSDPGNPRLAAHVVPRGAGATVAELKAFAAERVPGPLVPTLWGTLAALPLLGNGKIDRRALPALAPAASDLGDYVAPRTRAERAIAEVWAELLGVDRVGAHDRFFDLGGQSLLATRVAARLRDRFGVPVSVLDVFTAQTVAALAEAVARRGAERTTPIGPVPRDLPLPLSFAQRGLWFLDQLHPARTEYLVVTALRLRGHLDVDALSAAMAQVVARHEILRTRYACGPDGDPYQVVDDAPARFALPVEDADPHAVLAAELGTPIDLATGPVLRVRLARAAPDEHLLTMVIHHIATDGWSTGVLAADLAAAYRGQALPPLSLHYADFAGWQRARLADPAVLDGLLGYWRARLAGLEPTELPTDRSRPAVQDGAGRIVRFDVPPALAARVAAVARQAGATTFMTCLAGWFAVLARYTGKTDLAVGTPVAGRPGTQVDELVGLFSNAVVLRADLGGEPSFRTVLDRVRDTATRAYQHDELPFERLVEELAPQRDLSRNPLFQVLFAFREQGEDRFTLPGVDVSAEPVPWRTAKFDLTVELTKRADGSLAGEIEYATALFDSSTVDRIARHYVRLLDQAVREPDAAIHRLDLLDDAERRALTSTWNGPVTPRESHSLPELIGARATRAPHRVAVEYGTGSRSYREIDQAANRLAHHLTARGIGPDDVVGVCLPRRPELVVALLGVLRAGAAVLPLDPAHPLDRLTWIVGDSQARLVLVGDEGSPLHGADGLALMSLSGERPMIDSRPSDPVPLATDPDAIAYVIYTSGSTGRPKGVAVPHRGIHNRVLWAIERHGLCADDRLLQKTAVTFDAAMWEFLGPLVVGGTVVLAPEGTERDPAAMVEVVARERVTVLQGVPSLLRALADEPGLDRCTDLRLLFSAGEPLTTDLAGALCARVPATLVNTYGPTECSIDVTSWSFDPGAADPTGMVPIGRPLDNTRAVVYLPTGALAPVGVPGELHIGGDGLARGYLGRPRLTADRFVPDPHGPPGSRAYRTGDVVRRRPDGVLAFVGRTDDQVKIRGVRVELGEVEATLATHPAVAAAVVAARPGPDGLPRLVGYLVPRGDAPADRAIRAHLSATLPESHVPSVFVTLDRLPLTTSGKTDRAALPEPDLARRTEPVPPSTVAEKVVAGVMADVLGLDVVGVTDDFFDLGGHSLLATKVAGRLSAAFDLAFPVRAVFESRTAAAVARHVADLVRSGERRTAAVPDRAARDQPIPLSFGQQRLWLLDRLHPDGARYRVSWTLRLSGPLDVDALADALTALTARHEILRTRYVTAADGVPAQVVDPVVPVVPPVTDTDEDRLPALVGALVQAPFDLARRAPVDAHLVRLGPREHVFLLVMHHIVTDAWSETIMARELSELYGARVERREATLGPRPLQYADYAVWQRGALVGAALDAELRHWRERLHGLTPLELPTDRPRPAMLDGRGARVTCAVPAAVAAPLLALGRDRGATPFMTFLGVFCALMSRYTGSGDLAIGTAVAGRGRPELDEAVGFFVNTVVVRVDVEDDPTVATLIDRVRDSALDAFSHDELPFDRLVEELAPERDLSRSPLFDVSFGMREAGPEPPRLAGLAVRPVGTAHITAKVDLTCTLSAGADGGYEVELEYATALFDETTMHRMAGHFRTMAESAAAGPDRPVSGLSILDAAERDLVLRQWNPAPAPIPRECAHEAFRAQAARTPDALAVLGPTGERMTYAEVARRSGALAGRLRAAGVEAGAAVAVYLDKSPAAVVVLFGVLQAGATYVPLDTTQPAHRLALMVDDLAPALVVTDRRLRPRLDAVPVPVIAVEDDNEADGSEQRPGPAGDPDGVAYMIYTSGSTGRPKAVMVTHRAFTHHCREHAEIEDIRPGDRVLLHAPLTFDPAMEQIASPLVVGATVVVGEAGIVPPAVFPDRLAESGVTHLAISATYFRDVIAGVRHRDPRLAKVRVMAVGGEMVIHDDALRWFETGLDGRFLCVYGPTEATVASLTHHVTDRDLAAAAPETSVPIGRPIPGTRAYVLDDNLNPVPVGVAGELCVGGVRLSRGYLRQPRQTADRFVPDPFGGDPGERLYRTGDRVRYLPNGLVEFLGRFDTQVKLRGFRIELGEVEAALAGHPAVRAAVAAVQDLAPGNRQLVAYVVPHDEPPSPAELRAYLRDRLPDYMVPGVVLTLAELPTTSGQKVDRRRLPIPDPTVVRADAERDVAPHTEVEAAIAETWADVLGLASVGVHNEFFDLGGHSLLATRLQTRLQDLFGLEIPLRLLFEATTVSAQAAALERLAEAEAAGGTDSSDPNEGP
ncbi:amino acid adenylation domain-containing protein [Actinokineospora sp.]|uniref:amino acid adenylation domain-containing protein n=1 Tax=Actinokineospora sp. TaxID=1872133 RepID=UPI004037F41F